MYKVFRLFSLEHLPAFHFKWPWVDFFKTSPPRFEKWHEDKRALDVECQKAELAFWYQSNRRF